MPLSPQNIRHKKFIITLMLGAFMVTSAGAEDFYNITHVDGHNLLTIDGAYGVGVFNALLKFKETNQELKNFQIHISAGEDEYHDLIRVVFSPKYAPGEGLTLGGRTSLGAALAVYFSPADGEVVKVHGVR
jgi:hypothetical protein